MAHASNTAYETHKSEENANVLLNTKQPSVKQPSEKHPSDKHHSDKHPSDKRRSDKHPSVKPPKAGFRDLVLQAGKTSGEENRSKKRKRGQPDLSLEPNGLRNQELGAIAPERLEDGKRKKPKKPKKSKHGEPQEKDPVDSDEGARMKKYGAIFSKYQKSAQLAEAEKKSAPPDAAQEDAVPPVTASELHDLIPIPQPSAAPEPEYKPTFLALPSWLAKPIVVQSNATASFADLNLDSKLEENLKRKGYETSLAVQTAVIPLLLPGPKCYNGDVCISAATGSGKTLAYLLPMVERLRQKVLTRLRGLVVVPTRELVTQAREVAETCASGTGLQIGVAIGNVSLAEEQDRLVKKSQRYDPVARKKMHDDAQARLGVDFCEDMKLHEDLVRILPDHVPDFSSKVDILICTPGRLVDHIHHTRGFSLDDVEYLVIDEADRLLDESFQEWVATLLNALHSKKSEDQMTARQRVLGVAYPEKRRVRKVILSATMTRDLNKLASLRLQRPTLVSVVDHKDHDAEHLPTSQTAETRAENFELPSTLAEAAIPVGDGSEKPLHLLQLFHSKLSPSKVLVFTSNNENAGRLAHLLPMIDPSLDRNVGILTKASSSSKSSRKTLKAFQNGKLRILIASDRASRGLDVPDVAHVVNYDMPHSPTSYVHRVGRTARAGRKGTAWTLFTSIEARWFWNEIARSSHIGRGSHKVERIKVDVDGIGQDMRRMYEDALKKLQFAVLGDK